MLNQREISVLKSVVRGEKLSTALERAGYKSKSLSPEHRLRRVIAEYQAQELHEFIEESKELGFSGKYKAQKLKTLAESKDAFISLKAIETHHKIISSLKREEGSKKLSLSGNFIIPGTLSPDEWAQKVTEGEVKPVEKLPEPFLSVIETRGDEGEGGGAAQDTLSHNFSPPIRPT